MGKFEFGTIQKGYVIVQRGVPFSKKPDQALTTVAPSGG
jgi:hypothetical protein